MYIYVNKFLFVVLVIKEYLMHARQVIYYWTISLAPQNVFQKWLCTGVVRKAKDYYAMQAMPNRGSLIGTPILSYRVWTWFSHSWVFTLSLFMMLLLYLHIFLKNINIGQEGSIGNVLALHIWSSGFHLQYHIKPGMWARKIAQQLRVLVA